MDLFHAFDFEKDLLFQSVNILYNNYYIICHKFNKGHNNNNNIYILSIKLFSKFLA